MNKPVDVNFSFRAAEAAASEQLEQDQSMDETGRSDEGDRISREDVDPLDGAEPDEPRERDTVLPDAAPTMPDAGLAWERWRKEVRDAAAAWSRLTEADLRDFEAHAVTLTDLVEKRYSLARAEAERQVTSFVEDHQLFTL